MNTQTGSKELVHVYTTYGHLAGEIVRLMLESQDIPAFLSQESAGATYGLTVGRLGEARIYVPADRVNDARQVLRDMESGKFETDPIYYKRLPDQPYKNNKLSAAEIYKL